jgi:hypothetical protein
MIVIGPPMRCREDADREPVYEDRMRMPFTRFIALLLSASASASARSVGTVVVARSVCGYTPIFPKSMAKSGLAN